VTYSNTTQTAQLRESSFSYTKQRRPGSDSDMRTAAVTAYISYIVHSTVVNQVNTHARNNNNSYNYMTSRGDRRRRLGQPARKLSKMNITKQHVSVHKDANTPYTHTADTDARTRTSRFFQPVHARFFYNCTAR